MERCPFGVRIREVSIWRGSTVPSLKVITSAEREVRIRDAQKCIKVAIF